MTTDKHGRYERNYEGVFNDAEGLNAIKAALYQANIVLVAYDKIVLNHKYQNVSTVLAQAREAKKAMNELDQICEDVEEAINPTASELLYKDYYGVVLNIRNMFKRKYLALREIATAVAIADVGL